MDIIKVALQEDGIDFDVTTIALGIKDSKTDFCLIANEDCILSGIDAFLKVFKSIDKNIKVKFNFKNGDYVSSKSIVANLSGPSNSILKGERVSLNLISHLSGISTLTNSLVERVKNTHVKILDTRKTTPGYRVMERLAVIHGGGHNHRFNLSDRILIKDNHIAEVGGISTALTLANSYLKKSKKKYLIEIEVSNKKELFEAIKFKPDIIMFDNWSPNNIKKFISVVPKSISTEASGSINMSNIRQYASTGVDYISTSYMVKHKKWIDFSLEVDCTL